MRAVRVHGYHRPPQIDDVPEPTVKDPWDVVVRIGAAGLCRTDLHILEGQWAEKVDVDLPYTLGHENAGWVHDVGDAVSNVAPGDAVILHPHITCGLCRPCRAGQDVHCENRKFPGLDCDGGMADHLLTSARACVPLADGLEPVAVAALADAGLTAYHAVRKALPLLTPGTVCVVVGAGGLGHIGVQCVLAMTAATVIVVDRNPAALEVVRQYRVQHVVEADGTQVQQVLDLTGGAGADVVLDFVGEGGVENEALEMTRNTGSDFVIGYGGTITTPTLDMITTERNIVGNLVGTFIDLDELMTLAQQGKVELYTQTYPLERVQDAIADLGAGRLRGRGILVPG
jgi:NAD+-dependent secondary alcohol dehydrogenase Adh1